MAVNNKYFSSLQKTVMSLEIIEILKSFICILLSCLYCKFA